MIFEFLNVLFENVYVLCESMHVTSGTPFTICSCTSQCSLYFGGHCGCYLKHNSIFSPLLINSCLSTVSQLIVNEPTLPALCIPIP